MLDKPKQQSRYNTIVHKLEGMIKLNKQQQAVVDHKTGPLLVVAGAGTGKTRVIVERIAKLIADGVPRSSVLALTFTEKAAQEMLDRTSERLHESYGVEVPIYTFNAFGQLLLEEFAVEIGLSNSLKLVGEDGKVVFLRENLDALQLDYFAPVSRPDGQLVSLANYFSELKQQLITPEQYQKYADGLPANDEASRLKRQKHHELARAYGKYIELMRSRNTIDYDDQIYLLVELLEKRPNVAKILQERYSYIMIDEFQDTNPMQSKLIDLLGSKHQNIMVVGDDDQSIYGWRGATLANIQEFTTRYPKAKQITLIENYRSTQSILDHAWQLIQHNNPDRLEHLNKLDKRLQSQHGKGRPAVVHCFKNQTGESEWVANDIANRIKKGQDPGSIAVLARSKRGVKRFHEALVTAEIEHAVAGLGEELYEQLPVLMMIDALQAVWEPEDNNALYHTLASPLFECPPAVLSEASHKARYESTPLIEVLSQVKDKKLQSALSQIKSWHGTVHELTVREISYNILVDSGLQKRLFNASNADEVTFRTLSSLGQWFNTLVSFERIAITPSVHSYLENFQTLRAEGETLQDDTLNLTVNQPAVMTIHKAKGLEWQTVYVIDCTASSFPYLGGGKSLKVPDELKLVASADAKLAEERRLMYVAATRASEELIITYAERQAGSALRKPSRFIEEMGLKIGENGTSGNNHNAITNGVPHALQGIELPPRMLEGDSVVLSATEAEDYLDCPLNFYYKHVLGVPEKPTVVTKVGSLFHNLIQSINDAKLYQTPLPAKSKLLDTLKTDWPKSGYSSRLQRDRALAHGIKWFDDLYDRLVNEPVPIAVEERFRVHIPNSRCILKGRIDVVMPADNGVEIRDYKTSTSVTRPEDAKTRATGSKQLTMYAVAWRIMHDEVPSYASLDFVQTGQLGRVAKRAQSLNNMETKLSEAAEAILAGEFPASTGKHTNCLHQ